jgi:hypothetical protein
VAEPGADAVEDRLRELGFELPPAQSPVTKYRWAVRDGDVVHLAGHGPFVEGRPQFQGKVGRDLTVQEGYEANRVTALAILRTLKDELGSLERVVRPLSQVNYVNVVDGGLGAEFIEVGNGSTDLWADLWGVDVAYCARITVGASELPMGVPTAIMSVWKVR